MTVSERRRRSGAERRPEPAPRSPSAEPLLERGLGVPWLFAAAYSAVGFSIYFALGVVADRGLGLTPLIFLAAGLLFVLTTLTYVEGGAMFRERGGSSTFARHAFNELIAFIAGWAILIDYLIVDRPGGDLGARTTWSRSRPTSPSPAGRSAIAGGGDRRRLRAQRPQRHRPRPRSARSPFLALADLGLQLAVIVVGVLAVLHPDRLTDQLDLFTDPSFVDIVYAAVVAMLAYAGIEAASDLAPDIDVSRRDLKRVVSRRRARGAARLRRDGGDRADGGAGGRRARRAADGARRRVRRGAGAGRGLRLPPGLGRRHDALDGRRWSPRRCSSGRRRTSMLGVSRHIYTLAINRQIPSWLGKLEQPPRDAARGDRDLAA